MSYNLEPKFRVAICARSTNIGITRTVTHLHEARKLIDATLLLHGDEIRLEDISITPFYDVVEEDAE